MFKTFKLRCTKISILALASIDFITKQMIENIEQSNIYLLKY